MNLLVTVDEVMSSMGLNAALAEELTAVIESAITKAQLLVEDTLGTSISYSHSKEVFHTNVDLFCGITPGNTIRLKLGHFFLSSAVPVMVKVKDSLFAAETDVPDTDYSVDYEFGVVYLGTAYADKFVVVEYFSGFADSDTALPSIKQAIISKVPSIFRASQATTDSSEAPNEKTSNDTYMSLLSKYNRQVGFTFRSIQCVDSSD